MFENTYLVTDKLATFSEEEVKAAEAQLGAIFPAGYREYVTVLGKGDYCGIVSVYPPQIIVKDYLGEKPMLEEFCNSWEAGEKASAATSLLLWMGQAMSVPILSMM